MKIYMVRSTKWDYRPPKVIFLNREDADAYVAEHGGEVEEWDAFGSLAEAIAAMTA